MAQQWGTLHAAIATHDRLTRMSIPITEQGFYGINRRVSSRLLGGGQLGCLMGASGNRARMRFLDGEPPPRSVTSPLASNYMPATTNPATDRSITVDPAFVWPCKIILSIW